MNEEKFEITLKGKKFAIKWDAKAFYRFGREGGDIAQFNAKAESSAVVFANSAILLWAMLDDDARAKYKSPADVAELLIPAPDAKSLAVLNEAILSGAKEMKL